MYRLFSIGVLVMWIAAMGALVVRDVWPAWTAQDPPPITAEQLARLSRDEEQFGIFNGDSQRLGTAWSNITRTGPNSNIYGTMHIEKQRLLPELLIETLTIFDGDGDLDTFELDVFGAPFPLNPIQIRGQQYGDAFPCELRIGAMKRQASLQLSSSRMIGESMRPFTFLPELEVGQSWRMQVLDPLAAVLQRGTQFTPVIATVTGKEVLEMDDGKVECFVVELSQQRAKAWVHATGRVVQQEVEVPGMGTVLVKEERFDGKLRQEVRERVPRGSRMRPLREAFKQQHDD